MGKNIRKIVDEAVRNNETELRLNEKGIANLTDICDNIPFTMANITTLVLAHNKLSSLTQGR